MKPSHVFNCLAKVAILLFAVIAMPLFLSAQSNTKKTTAPPPPPKASAPATTQKQPPPAPKAPPTTAKTPPRAPKTPLPTAKTPPTFPNPRPTHTGTKTTTSGTSVGGGDKGRGPYVSRPGDEVKQLPGGRTEHRNPNGQVVTTNARGEVKRIEAPRGLAGGNKIVINRVPGGGRVVETGHPGARVVSYGPHRGFVERTVRPGYISRTYVRGGRSYARVYREYRYHNVVYYRYVPAFYYGPRFYVWAVTPWGAPVPYIWAGLATPWFGFYAGYFTPYPVYASPDLWLTDYLLAENLRLAYENQQADNGDQAPPPQPEAQPTAATLSPEMKALIADEVRQQLAAEKAAAAQPTSTSPKQPATGGEPLPPALTQRYFVVSSNLDITTTTGQACSLTPGDVIKRKGTEVSADGGVTVEVDSSKPGDCAVDSEAAIQVADLQEMHNQFREQIDSGLKTLAENRAKGLPGGPDATAHFVPEGNADRDPDAEKQLVAQDAEATTLEAQVQQTGSTN